MENNCETCKAYGEKEQKMSEFIAVSCSCRKHAPPWPSVNFDDWCLEWEAKESKEVENINF